jgi:hypothetical protein
MTTYKTVYDIMIPAGTLVSREPPHDTSFPVETAMIEVDIPILSSMSHLAIDWQDAIDAGLVIEGAPEEQLDDVELD